MGYLPQQTGWSTESKLLQSILKQLDRLTKVASTITGGSSTPQSIQDTYDNSSPASITLATGKSFTVYDTDGSTVLFKIDPALNGTVNPLPLGTYSTTLTFDTDKDIYQDVTGTSPVYTIAGSGNVNGVGIILRLNKPTAFTITGAEADPSSSAVNATKLNVITCVYFSNWNGSGTGKVIYKNSLYTAI